MARYGRKIVSIPIWCDYKDFNCFLHFMFFEFQFQYGAIISSSSGITLLSLNIVSIPIWCDYKDNCFVSHARLVLFQFQYGAIISEILRHIPLV